MSSESDVDAIATIDVGECDKCVDIAAQPQMSCRHMASP